LAYDGCYTLYDIFRRGVRLSTNGGCLGHREVDEDGNAGPYSFRTYGEVL